jgi:hypothetical protein
MAASRPSPVFTRGSAVLEYWLVHAEGLTVVPPRARVVRVVAAARTGRADALIVRSRLTRRRRSIPASAIAAVEPASGQLLLDGPQTHRLQAVGRACGRCARYAGGRTEASAEWLAPRVRAAARAAAVASGRVALACAATVAHLTRAARQRLDAERRLRAR